jgi:hypothetical protein
MQFFINHWHQSIERGAVTTLPVVQKLRNFVCRGLPQKRPQGKRLRVSVAMSASDVNQSAQGPAEPEFCLEAKYL